MPVEFLVTPFQERGATFSPNGRWLAYVSDKSGQNEVYVRPYPGPGDEFIISVGGGQEPVWSPDGQELYYRRGQQMLAVPVETDPTFVPGTEESLFEGDYDADSMGVREVPFYDISPTVSDSS